MTAFEKLIKFFKDCLPQILLGPFEYFVSHVMSVYYISSFTSVIKFEKPAEIPQN